MKMYNTTKIRREDVPEAPDWITKIIGPINQFIEQMASAMQGKIDFKVNIQAEIKEIKVKTTDLPYTTLTTSLPTVSGVIPLAVFISDTPTTTINAALGWHKGTEGISIDSIYGLTAGVQYTVRLLIL